MKKVLVLFLSFILVFSLIGCNKEESDGAKTETTEKAGDVTRIAFVSYQALDSSEWLQNLVKGLEQFTRSCMCRSRL